jgi:hypothetical protein
MVSNFQPPEDQRNSSKCPPWVSVQVLQETNFGGTVFFHHIWLGLFTTISFGTSFQNRCKMWICSLGFIYGSYLMALQEIFVCRVSGTVDWTWWTNSTIRSFPWFKSLTFLSQGDFWSVMFVLQTSVTSETGNNEYRMDLRCFALHLELSSEWGHHSPDLHSRALKVKVDILNTFFNLQEAVARKPYVRRLVPIYSIFPLYFDADLPSVGLA